MFPLKFTSEKSTFNIKSHIIKSTHYWKRAGQIVDFQLFSWKCRAAVFSFFCLHFFWKCNLHHDMHLWQKVKSSVTKVSLSSLFICLFSDMVIDYILQKCCRLQFSVNRVTIHTVWNCLALLFYFVSLFKILWLEIYK